MSLHHSPKIVTNGLVLCLDAGNRKSYSGSGTTWRDLSGNNNHGTLIGSPSFTNNSFNFIGNNYITTPLNIYSQDNSIFSINLWFKATANGIILHQTTAANNGTNSGWVPAVYIDSNNKLRITCFWGVGVSGGYTTPNDVVYNKWYHIVHTFDSSNNRRVYIDGLLVSTINGSQESYSSTFYLILGAGSAASWPNDPATGMRGSIANFSFYKKVLSQAEILQNYNALKGRFNL